MIDTMSLSVIEVLDVSTVQLVYASYIRADAPTGPTIASTSLSLMSSFVRWRKFTIISEQPASVWQRHVHAWALISSSGANRFLGESHPATRGCKTSDSQVHLVHHFLQDGEWLEALALALDLFETSVKPFATHKVSKEHYVLLARGTVLWDVSPAAQKVSTLA